MPHLTMTYEYYYTLGVAWGERHKLANEYVAEMEKHIEAVPAYLKIAFRDGVASV